MEGPDRAERLAALFDVHADRLYRLARRLTACADDALDLVQETFLRAARALETVPNGFAGEEAWLTRVLVNIRRDEWRKATVRRDYATEQQRPAGRVDGPEAAYVASADVWKALDRLSPRRRAVLVLHELEWPVDIRHRLSAGHPRRHGPMAPVTRASGHRATLHCEYRRKR